MKNIMLVMALLSAAGAATAENIVGASSDTKYIDPKSSDIFPFGWHKPGLKIKNISNGKWSASINLENGPIKFINKKYGATYSWLGVQTGNPTPINAAINQNVDGTLNPKYLTISDVNPVLGWFNNQTLGQIWYEKRAYNTDVYSVRQTAEPAIAIAPKFGGLVIGKVADLPANTSVYFGEWAPRDVNLGNTSSTDLNMDSDKRTVWFVGENTTKSMPTLVSAKYDVIGINQHVPGQNDFYTGTLTANYGAGSGSLTGSLNRGNDSVVFSGVDIYSNGVFSSNNGVQGRFYGNQAEALAGFSKRGTATVADDVAFGGKKRN